MSRRRGSWITLLTAGLAAGAITLAGCSSSSSSAGGSGTTSSGAPSGTPIAIDSVQPLTGNFAQYGQGESQGIKAAADLINSHGGVLGRPLKVYEVDDQSDTGKAAAAASQLLAQHPASVMFAGATTAEDLAIAPIATAQKVITWHSSTNPATTDVSKYPYSYNVYPPAAVSVPAYVAAMKAENVSKLAVIYGNDAGQKPLGTASIAAAKSAGIDVAYSAAVDQTATTFTSQLQAAKNAGAGAVLLLLNVPTTYTTFFKNFVNIGWTSPLVLMTPSAANATVLGSVPSQLSDVKVIAQRSVLQASDETELLKAVVKQISQTSGASVVTGSNMADALSITAWAMKSANSTDAVKIVAQLNGLADKSLPSGVLSGGGFPDPHYSDSVHDFTNANMGNSWALIKPSTPVDGQYQGNVLSLS